MKIEQIAIMGGGMSGLALALYLRDSGCQVTILERDAPPPDITPDQAFEQWTRPGVPQFRHAHMFLARLQTLLRDDHPELFEEVQAAGLELSQLDEVLPDAHVGRFPSIPEDADLLHFWGRRPTLEFVLRRYVARLPHVRFVHDATVEGLVLASDGPTATVRGVEYSQGGESKTLTADLVVDALGKRTKSPEWLAAAGVDCDAFSAPTERIYVCRHYRLKDPAHSPRRRGTGADLDFFGYSTFYAEHGHYAITLSCPVEERGFAARMKRVEGFEAICRQFPELSNWIDASEPVSKVLGAGGFQNRWTRFGTDGGKPVNGFVAIGDAHMETNPMYGRGCASAFMQAKTLSECLASEAGVEAAVKRYYDRSRSEMKIHFDFCVNTDNMFKVGGRRARGLPLTGGERFIRWGYENAWMPAMNRSPVVAREMLKAMQMREPSALSTRLVMIAQIIVAFWGGVLGRLLGRKPAGAAPEVPARAVFLPAVGVDPSDVQDKDGPAEEALSATAGVKEP